MVWTVKNNRRKLAQLQTTEDVTCSDFETETELRLQLYVGTDTISVNENTQYKYGFKRMTLQIECDGTEIALGERFGDLTPADRERYTNYETKLTKTFSGGGSLNLDPVSILTDLPIKAEAAGEIKSANEKTTTEGVTEQRNFVTAKSNDEWEIACLDGKALNAKFLNPDQVLCRVKPLPNRNRNGIQVHLYANRNDLVFAEPAKFPWLNGENRTKEKIFKTLLGIEIAGRKKDLEPNLEVQLSYLSNDIDED